MPADAVGMLLPAQSMTAQQCSKLIAEGYMQASGVCAYHQEGGYHHELLFLGNELPSHAQRITQLARLPVLVIL
jgi:hypothetical protein